MKQHEHRPAEGKNESSSGSVARSCPPTFEQLVIWRLVFVVFLSGFGLFLISSGKQAIESRAFDVAVTTSTGPNADNFGSDRRSTSLGVMHYRGREAVEHGVGLFGGGPEPSPASLRASFSALRWDSI